MLNEQSLEPLAVLIDKYSGSDGIHPTAIAGLNCLRLSETGQNTPAVYTPCLCLIAQGAKSVHLGTETFHYAPSQYLAVSIDLPLIGEVTKATPSQPYLCVQIELNPQIIGELAAQAPHLATPREDSSSRGLYVEKADAALVDSFTRLMQLLETPRDLPMLAPLALREVYYRLLSGPQGQNIAQIAIAGTTMHRIAATINHLKNNYREPIRIDELAAMARMSASTFHHHFKEVTALSPLQYQKRLRLMEARRLMLSENSDAASAAYGVGYESPSQFSREYARYFGAPPARDITALRRAHA